MSRKCPTCDGEGTIACTNRTCRDGMDIGDWLTAYSYTCATCDGTGEVTCPECDGEKWVDDD